jgi:hypothetical protein
MKDRAGYDYNELVAMQREHLAIWQPRLRPALFDEVRAFVLSINRQAPRDEDKHRVYRGQDLIEIIRTWPDLSSAYKVAEMPALAASDLI